MTSTEIRRGLESHLQNFRVQDASGADFVERLRRDALDRFTALGFPTTRLEDWKYTNLAPVAGQAFCLSPRVKPGDAVRQAALRHRIGAGCQLVFLNGHFAAELSSMAPLANGVVVSSMSAALTANQALIEGHLAHHAGTDSEASTLAVLNTAFVHDGAFVYLPRGTAADAPVHLLFLSEPSAAPFVTHPRILIIADESSHADVVEQYVGLGDGPYWTNAVTEIVVGPNAHVLHCKVQRECEEAFHVATVAVRQAADSRFVSRVFSLGSALARNDIHALLDAPGAECVMDGLYLTGGRQHTDHHTCVDHRQPRCTSRELYKGILEGSSTAVFNGKVFVRPDAQKSDAQQMNKNLLLSEDAVVDTKPQLEIFADDVRCSHGATIGRLDDEEVFYLRSRGIDHDAARRMLIEAFAAELIGRLDIEPLRVALTELVLARVGQAQ